MDAKNPESKVRWCDGCGALMEKCCNAAQTRRLVANDLSNIIQRQSVKITELTRELSEAKQIIDDLRAKRAP